MESFVMPAWIAGIHVRRMRPETSMSAWIQALPAGMTESRSRTKTDPGPPPLVFSKELRRAQNKILNVIISECALRGDTVFTYPFSNLKSVKFANGQNSQLLAE